MDTNSEEYTVRVRGVEVQCHGIEQVVEAVRALEVLASEGEREVAAPLRGDREVGVPNATDSPLTRELYALLREAPRALRPVEIVKALRKRGFARSDVKYARVYGALRHGDFEKQGGRWSVSDAA